MAFKNYYLILGVPREETQAGIRARYRDLVKHLHPDVAGEASTSAFQEIEEAYDVLSDPENRRRYNRDLRFHEHEDTPVQHPQSTGPRAGTRPGRPGPRYVREPMSLRDFRTVRPSFEALFDRILRNSTGAGVPKSEHPEPLDFEVILTREEAARGGVVPMEIPVFRTCMACGGMGRNWMFYCAGCRGRGLITEERLIEVRIPPINRSPAVFEVPLHGLGIRNLFLQLHIRVGGTEGA